jgi:hypothetical protein
VISCPAGQTVVVQSTAVVVGNNIARRPKSDPDRVLERALVDMAQRYLPPELYEFLGGQTRTN